MTSSPSTEQRSPTAREADEASTYEVERLYKGADTRDRAGEPRAPEALPADPAAFVLHFLGFYKWPLLLMALLELGQAACQILIPKAVQRLIDSAAAFAGTGGEAVWTLLAEPLRFFVLLNLGILVFSRSSGSLLVMLGPELRRRVRHSLYRYLQSHSQRYFLGNFAGSLANRIAEVSLGVNHSLWTVMFDFWPVTVTLAVSLVLLAQVATWLALVLGLWSLGYVAVSYLLAMRCREYAKAFAAARSAVSGKIVDAVTNVMSAKLFARLEHERRYLSHYLDREVKTARRTFWFMERMRWFQFVATLALQVGMIVFAARLWVEGAISVGSFAMVASLLLLVINDVRNLSRRFLEFFEYIGNVTDGVGVIIRPHEVTDAEGARELEVTAGEIRFENVDFA
jgi:ATP-binding cassette subfamily B protein